MDAGRGLGRIHGLEGQLHAERERYDRLLEDVKAGKIPSPSQKQRRAWWRLWQWQR